MTVRNPKFVSHLPITPMPSSALKDKGVQTYLADIGTTALLTPNQEIELAKRIRKGDSDARLTMIQANLRLVVKIALDYQNCGLALPDLISEGNLGLIKAVERFRPDKGAKLSTYAAWWIKQSIKRALANQGKIIRLPVHAIDKLSKMRRLESTLEEELGREPSLDEIAREAGIDRGRISMLKCVSVRPASLDAPLTSDDDSTMADVVPDKNAATPLDSMSQSELIRILPSLLTCLDSREKRIIEARFGLGEAQPKTLEEVGEEFGVTRERIRQLQNLALIKLRRALHYRESPPSSRQEKRPPARRSLLLPVHNRIPGMRFAQ